MPARRPDPADAVHVTEVTRALDAGQEPARVAHASGAGADIVAEIVSPHLRQDGPATPTVVAGCDRPVLIAACGTRFGEHASLVVWRLPRARDWDNEDRQLAASSVSLIRMTLEREAVQLDVTRQARTDPLTGLLNRRAFLEEIERHATRVDREHQPGTVMFAEGNYSHDILANTPLDNWRSAPQE